MTNFGNTAHSSRKARRSRRRLSGAVAALCALSMVAAACGSDSDTDSAGSTPAGDTAADGTTAATTGDSGSGGDARELIIARDMDLQTLDPQRAYCDTCQIFLTAVYETLIGIDPNDPNVQVPRLATDWVVNDDNTEFTFNLDPSAVFADGTPVTSADVKWSWERLANIEGPASYLMSGYTAIDTPDDQTVIITFENPNSAFLPIVSASYLGIVNSKVAEADGGAIAAPGAVTDDQAEQWFLSNSAGSGPYTLTSYTDGDSLVLTRNENYWGATPATFPKVTMKQVQDSTAQLQQLQAGDVDIAMQISVDSMGQLEGDPNIVSATVNSYNYVYIALSPGAVGAEGLADNNVRQAIKLALDYDGILDVTVAGAGQKQASPIPNGFIGSADLALPEQNLEEAKALMAASDFPDGFTVNAMYPTVNVYGVDFDTMMQKVQQDLKEIGVELELQPVEFPQWIDQINAEGIPVTAVYFAPDHTDSSQYVQYFGSVDGSSWATRAGGGDGGAPIIDPNENDLLAQALAASGDAKTTLYTELGQSMMDANIIVPLVNSQLVQAYAADITNMHNSACCNLELNLLGLK